MTTGWWLLRNLKVFPFLAICFILEGSVRPEIIREVNGRGRVFWIERGQGHPGCCFLLIWSTVRFTEVPPPGSPPVSSPVSPWWPVVVGVQPGPALTPGWSAEHTSRPCDTAQHCETHSLSSLAQVVLEGAAKAWGRAERKVSGEKEQKMAKTCFCALWFLWNLFCVCWNLEENFSGDVFPGCISFAMKAQSWMCMSECVSCWEKAFGWFGVLGKILGFSTQSLQHVAAWSSRWAYCLVGAYEPGSLLWGFLDSSLDTFLHGKLGEISLLPSVSQSCFGCFLCVTPSALSKSLTEGRSMTLLIRLEFSQRPLGEGIWVLWQTLLPLTGWHVQFWSGQVRAARVWGWGEEGPELVGASVQVLLKLCEGQDVEKLFGICRWELLLPRGPFLLASLGFAHNP